MVVKRPSVLRKKSGIKSSAKGISSTSSTPVHKNGSSNIVKKSSGSDQDQTPSLEESTDTSSSSKTSSKEESSMSESIKSSEKAESLIASLMDGSFDQSNAPILFTPEQLDQLKAIINEAMDVGSTHIEQLQVAIEASVSSIKEEESNEASKSRDVDAGDQKNEQLVTTATKVLTVLENLTKETAKREEQAKKAAAAQAAQAAKRMESLDDRYHVTMSEIHGDSTVTDGESVLKDDERDESVTKVSVGGDKVGAAQSTTEESTANVEATSTDVKVEENASEAVTEAATEQTAEVAEVSTEPTKRSYMCFCF